MARNSYLSFIKKLIYITLFLLSFQGIAQNFADKTYYLIDSLDLNELTPIDQELLETSLKQYHLTKSDTGKVNALNSICENMMHQSWEKYQFFQYNLIKRAIHYDLSIGEKNNLKKVLANAVNNIGVIYVLKGKVVKGLSFFEQSLTLKEELKDQVGVAEALNNIGIFYYGQGDISLAIEYYERSLMVMEKLNDQRGMATSFEGIGIVHKEQGDLNLALSYFDKALAIHLKMENKRGIAQMYNNIGVVHKINGDFDKGLLNYENSLKLRKEIQDKRGMAETLTNMGHLHQEHKNLDEANLLYLKAFELRTELNDQRGLVFSYNDIGEIYLKQGNLKAAQLMGENGLRLSQSIEAPKTIQRNANLLSLVYEAQGKGLKALAMYRLSEHMKDSLNNESTQRASIRQQTKYEFDKARSIKDIEHQNQLMFEQEEKKKQKIISYGTAIVLILVAIFLIIVFNRLKITRKQKLVIEEQKKIVDQKNIEITDSITYAKRIQSAILPADKVVKEYLKESFILYKPKDIVAGDFYWMESVAPTGSSKEPMVLFAAADCTGHGVPGAMVSVVCNNGLNRAVREYGLTDPGKILDKTRALVIQEFEKSEDEVNDGMDIALCALQGNTLKYAGAHNPLLIIRNGEIIETKANKQPIGKFDNPEPYTTHSFDLEQGDSLYIFSDGYVDQFGGEKGKKFKTKAFRELLLSIQDKAMEEQKTLINDSFETWKGAIDQIDDVCVIGVRV